MLGYCVGEQVQDARPAVTGPLRRPDLSDLKQFGAATATSGESSSITCPASLPGHRAGGRIRRATVPKARTTARASGAGLRDAQRPGQSTMSTSCCSAVRTHRWTRSPGSPSCWTADDLHSGTELWVMTPRALRTIADRNGYTRIITAAGGHVLTDSCPAMSKAAPPAPRVRHRLGEAGALPAGHPRHRGWFGTWTSASMRPSPDVARRLRP